MNDPHDHPILEYLIDHPKFASPCRVSARELIAKRLADAVGMLGEWTANELPTSDGDRFGK